MTDVTLGLGTPARSDRTAKIVYFFGRSPGFQEQQVLSYSTYLFACYHDFKGLEKSRDHILYRNTYIIGGSPLTCGQQNVGFSSKDKTGQNMDKEH